MQAIIMLFQLIIKIHATTCNANKNVITKMFEKLKKSKCTGENFNKKEQILSRKLTNLEKG